MTGNCGICFILMCIVGLSRCLECPSTLKGLERCNCTVKPHSTINSVICVDLGHLTHYALESLSETPEIERLEYTGNNIKELEANIFGECHNTNLDLLIYIDLSNNHIQIIHGQSFHCVPNVRVLKLNYNEWLVDPSKERVFSSMPMLNHLELHSAFKVDMSGSRSINMKPIFYGSHMTMLTELHLEENGIEFIDKGTFCMLPNLDSLHLSSNRLNKIHFDCLSNLHHLYARSNLIETLLEEDIKSLEEKKKLSVLDLSNNPFQCTDCSGRTTYFRDWLQTQSRFVVEKYKLTCAVPEDLVGQKITELTDQQLDATCPTPNGSKKANKTTIITAVILSIIAVLTAIFLYVNRHSIKKSTSRCLKPIRRSAFMKRLHFGYSTMETDIYSVNNDEPYTTGDTMPVIEHAQNGDLSQADV